MQISILSVTVEHMPGKNGGYDKAEVAYKGEDGKVSGKNIVSFNAPEAFDVIKAAKNGDVLDVTSEKDAKGYWQWVKVVKLDAAQAATQQASTAKAGAATASPKNTYETPEERVLKQLYIVRQSAINAAIATLTPGANTEFTVEDVIALAKTYEAHVYRKEEGKQSFSGDFQDDSAEIV
jgi:cell wall-associated NlpC family hydrolase